MDESRVAASAQAWHHSGVLGQLSVGHDQEIVYTATPHLEHMLVRANEKIAGALCNTKQPATLDVALEVMSIPPTAMTEWVAGLRAVDPYPAKAITEGIDTSLNPTTIEYFALQTLAGMLHPKGITGLREAR
jgi:hypothetical protein